MKITIVAYQPEWAIQFEHLKAVFQSHIKNIDFDVQHVGSTSVPGLAAKPVIDIDLIVESEKHFPSLITLLEKLGYGFFGEMGVTGRLAFKQLTALTPNDGSNSQWPKHHLYVCQADSIGLKNHLVFRDALRSDSELAYQYGQLKKYLANNSIDMNQYVTAKTDFIVSVLRNKGVAPEILNTIINDNKAE